MYEWWAIFIKRRLDIKKITHKTELKILSVLFFLNYKL